MTEYATLLNARGAFRDWQRKVGESGQAGHTVAYLIRAIDQVIDMLEARGTPLWGQAVKDLKEQLLAVSIAADDDELRGKTDAYRKMLIKSGVL